MNQVIELPARRECEHLLLRSSSRDECELADLLRRRLTKGKGHPLFFARMLHRQQRDDIRVISLTSPALKESCILIFMKPKRQKDPALLAFVRTLPCVACARPGPSDAHHVTSKGAGGGDYAENVMPLCRSHHQDWHNRPFQLIEKFPAVAYWLGLAGRSDFLERILSRAEEPTDH